jgi:hypothetical protein
MDLRLEHPKLLDRFQSAHPAWLKSWAWLLAALWLLLAACDWTARFQVFQWQDRWWNPRRFAARASLLASNVASVRGGVVPEQMGAGLTALVPVPRIAAQYEEFHAAYEVPRDEFGYSNAAIPPGWAYRIVVLGDSFMVSLGTQTIAQVLAEIGGVNVYNHSRAGRGPFWDLRIFIRENRFSPPPAVAVWSLSARDMGAPLFLRQPVDDWFDRAEISPSAAGTEPPRTWISWDRLYPSELRRVWPNTSLAAYYSRRVWARLKLVVFRGWPPDVRGVEDPLFGPMLFYGDNLRALPLITPEKDGTVAVRVATRIARRLRERGTTLVVLLVPEKEQIHIRALPKAMQASLAHGPELFASIEQGLEAEGVPVVNLMPVFQERTAAGQRLYWRDDTHWNDDGIRLAAEQLWRVVEPLLEDKSGDRGQGAGDRRQPGNRRWDH